MAELTDTHRAVLDFERQVWCYTGAKEAAVRAELGMSLVRYNQTLAWLITQRAALEYAPATVRRLQLLRDRRMAERGRVFGRAG